MAERINRFMIRPKKPVKKVQKTKYVDQYKWFVDMIVNDDPILKDIFETGYGFIIMGASRLYMKNTNKPGKGELANHIWKNYIKCGEIPEFKELVLKKFEEYNASFGNHSWEYDHSKWLNEIKQAAEAQDNMPNLELSGDDEDESEGPPPLINDSEDSDEEVDANGETYSTLFDKAMDKIKPTPLDAIAQGKYSDLIKQAIEKGDNQLVNTLLNFANNIDAPNEEVKILKDHIKELSATNQWLEMKLVAANDTLRTIREIVE